ncbi:unnamed protein product [Blepharisma stoltei]|uniref:Uncharacterized protein n=1 Tax=Blepharisma stoltei TaxID=1481888 RepID=A0AAU9IEU4_9CILI|nr:unnamed protein product [Blepharisma stoltei]
MISNSKSSNAYTELKLKELKFFKLKIANIKSRKLVLERRSQKSNELEFYGSNNIKLDKLETLKESSEKIFWNIKTSYQTNWNLIYLFKTEKEIRDIYSKYIEAYNDYSRKINEMIQSLKASSSSYIYEDTKYLYLFDNMVCGVELIQFDIEKSQQKKINIGFDKIVINDIMTVLLPNNELFFLGINKIYCIACTIDLNSYKIKRVLPLTYYNYKSGIFITIASEVSILLEENPFTRSSEEKTLIQRFDLISNRWIVQPSIPNLLTSFSAVPFKTKVLIAGSESKNYIYEYDISLESFSKIDFRLENTRILLLTGNSRVYLLENDGVYGKANPIANMCEIK